jgi:hypothetical protein
LLEQLKKFCGRLKRGFLSSGEASATEHVQGDLRRSRNDARTQKDRSPSTVSNGRRISLIRDRSKWWLVLLVTCGYALYYERIMLAEEAFLRGRFGERFEQWATATPAFIPRFRAWKPSPVPFCWRTVLQREYNAFFMIVSAFFALDVVGDSITERRFKLDLSWFVIFVVGFVIFATLRTLKKRTRLLTVEGR